MKIAAGGEVEAAVEERLEFIPARANHFGNELEAIARMRRGDDVVNALGDGHFGHSDGDFEGFGAVVQSREDVAMDVDHEEVEDSAGVRG